MEGEEEGGGRKERRMEWATQEKETETRNKQETEEKENIWGG